MFLRIFYENSFVIIYFPQRETNDELKVIVRYKSTAISCFCWNVKKRVLEKWTFILYTVVFFAFLYSVKKINDDNNNTINMPSLVYDPMSALHPHYTLENKYF